MGVWSIVLQITLVVIACCAANEGWSGFEAPQPGLGEGVAD